MTSVRWWPVCLIVAGILVVADLSLSPLLGLETDLWWHLASGQRFFQHGLELKDPFSLTFFDQFWIRIDWLYQVAVYAVYWLGGLGALLLARSAILLASAWLMGAVLRRQQVSWGRTWLVVMLTALIWSQAAGLRPATLSIFFTCLWVFLLEEARCGRTRRLWLLPPLMVLWYNFHVAALAGVLLLGLYALGQVVDWRIFGQARPSVLWLAMIPATLVGALVTPQPGKLLYYPIQFLIFKSPWNQTIQEVQPADWDMAGTPESRLLLLMAALGALVGLKRRQTTGLWLCLVCGTLMNATYRHQFQLSSVLTPLAGQALAAWTLLPALSRARGALALVALALGARAAVSLWVCKLPPSGLLRHESYPEAKADWLSRLPDRPGVFTDMNTAGYYLWIFAGGPKLFIDSRTDQVYSRHEFVAEYFAILLGQPPALALLDHYKVDVVALQNLVSGPLESPLDHLLSQSPVWGPPVYQDSIGRVYLRASLPRPARLPRPPLYLEAFEQGRALHRMGRTEAALEKLFASLVDYPQFPYAHQMLARIWLDQGRLGDARRELARAELYHPNAGFVDQDWSRWSAQGGWSGWVWWPWLRRYCLPYMAL